MGLDNMANIAQTNAGAYDLNGFVHTFLRHLDKALGMSGYIANAVHFAGVAVPTIFDDGDINIDDVAVFEDLSCRLGIPWQTT